MNEQMYLVNVNGKRVAENMNIKDATLFVKALFEEYYCDKKMCISIMRMDWEDPEEEK